MWMSSKFLRVNLHEYLSYIMLNIFFLEAFFQDFLALNESDSILLNYK